MNDWNSRERERERERETDRSIYLSSALRFSLSLSLLSQLLGCQHSSVGSLFFFCFLIPLRSSKFLHFSLSLLDPRVSCVSRVIPLPEMHSARLSTPPHPHLSGFHLVGDSWKTLKTKEGKTQMLKEEFLQEEEEVLRKGHANVFPVWSIVQIFRRYLWVLFLCLIYCTSAWHTLQKKAPTSSIEAMFRSLEEI